MSVVGDAATYARALAKLEILQVMQPSYAMGATRGPLFRRIERLLDAKRHEQGSSRLACAVGLLAGVLCLVLNMSWAQDRKDEVPTSQDVRRTILAPDPSTLIVSPQTIPSLDPPPPPPVALSAAPTLPPPSPPPAETLVGTVLGGLGLQGIVQETPPTLHTAAVFVLFRGNEMFSDGAASPADIAQARAAQQAAGGGDLLWFSLEGRCRPGSSTEPLAARDKAMLDRVNELYVSSQVRADVERIQSLMELERKRQRDSLDRDSRAFADAAQIRREVQALQGNFQTVDRSIAAQRPDTPDLARVQSTLEQMHMTMNQLRSRMENTNEAEEDELARRRAEIDQQIAALIAQTVTDNVRRAEAELMEMLRAAVRSGIAEPSQ